MRIGRATIAAMGLLAACHPTPRAAESPQMSARPVALEAGPHRITRGVLRGLMTTGELRFAIDDAIADELRRLPSPRVAVTRVSVCLDVEGTATVDVDDRSGSPAFDRAALALASDWRFEPYHDGRTITPACGHAVFRARWPQSAADAVPRESSAALPAAAVELPRGKVVELALPHAIASLPPTPGLALVWVCRRRGARSAPQFGVIQRSGDPDIDRRLLARRVTMPVDEAPEPDPLCMLWSAVVRRDGSAPAYDAELVDDAPPPDDAPPAVPPPSDVPPRALEAKRISGERIIMPAMAIRDQIGRSAPGTVTFLVPVKVCVDTTGRPFAITILRSSGYAGYDADLTNGIATWRYRPFTIDGRPAPACGLVNFAYKQTKSDR